MIKNKLNVAFARFVAVVGLLVFANGLWAQGKQPTCTPADMAGDFATLPAGTLLGGPLAGPFFAAGSLHFDGVSRFSGTASSSFSGFILFPFDAAGSYTVTPDCVVSVHEETLGINFTGYFTKNKNEVVFFEPDPGTVTSNVLHRQRIKNCTARDLSDEWAIQATGSIFSSPGAFSRLFAQIGRLTFDGKGGFSGATSSTGPGGSIVNNTVSGTYSMNANCTFTASITDNNAVTSRIFGILYGLGEEFYFDYGAPGPTPPNGGLPGPGNPATFTGLVVAGTGRQAVNIK